jgi:hypothetical protein
MTRGPSLDKTPSGAGKFDPMALDRSRFEGEQVSVDHAVSDGDVVELHW